MALCLTIREGLTADSKPGPTCNRHPKGRKRQSLSNPLCRSHLSPWSTVIAHSVDADGQRVHAYQLCPQHANQVARRKSIQWSGSAYAARHSEYELEKSITV